MKNKKTLSRNVLKRCFSEKDIEEYKEAVRQNQVNLEEEDNGEKFD